MSKSSNYPVQGCRDYPSHKSFVFKGTSPLNLLYSGTVNQGQYATATIARDVLRAHAFVWPGGGMDAIYLEATGVVANAVGRAGIYRNTGDTTIYPSSRVVDGGEVALATAVVRSSSISVSLEPGLYWFAQLCGVADPVLRVIAVGGVSHIGGMSSAWALGTQLTVAYPYAALPAEFPAGAAWDTGTPPVVAVHPV